MRRVLTIAVVIAFGFSGAHAVQAGPTEYVVADGATLHREPDAATRGLKTKGVVLLEFVAEHGDWYEVTLTGEPIQCVAGNASISLRLFVRKQDTLPVATSEVRRRFANEGEILVGKDTPLIDPVLRRMVPTDALGHRFRARSPQLGFSGSAEPSHEFIGPIDVGLGNGASLRVGDRGLDYAVVKRRGTTRWLVEIDSVSHPCARITGWVSARLLRPARGGVIGVSRAFVPTTKLETRLRVGATVSWPDGSTAGKVIVPVGFTAPVRTRGSLRCARFSVGDVPDQELCFNPADLAAFRCTHLTAGDGLVLCDRATAPKTP